ncbi:peptidoglycan bridge formation glycyltransferase FemA/FemB family protein, partial [Staphylococcus saprophyticus]|uniref:peptidoglycan bridge formation glycyltransferase FemA/FemB family protein n=1 Tax=Staphylococcus saprophyticus TaxID=29385 RepID=UPI0037044AF8
MLNLPPPLYFPNPYQLNYFSPPSSQKYNQYMPPYIIHSYIINYSFHHPYPPYNFYPLSPHFTQNTQHYPLYPFKRPFNLQIHEF